MAEDVTWDHTGPENVPLNKVYQGHAGIGEFFSILDETQDKVAFDVHELHGSGDRVVALGHFGWKVKATGKTWDSDFAMVFTVNNGLVTHWNIIFDKTAEAVAFQPESVSV